MTGTRFEVNLLLVIPAYAQILAMKMLLSLFRVANAGLVAFSYPVNGNQNGLPDCITQVDNTSKMVQFLRYEGRMTAVNGQADGMASTDIGAVQPDIPSVQLILHNIQVPHLLLGMQMGVFVKPFVICIRPISHRRKILCNEGLKEWVPGCFVPTTLVQAAYLLRQR